MKKKKFSLNLLKTKLLTRIKGKTKTHILNRNKSC